MAGEREMSYTFLPRRGLAIFPVVGRSNNSCKAELVHIAKVNHVFIVVPVSLAEERLTFIPRDFCVLDKIAKSEGRGFDPRTGSLPFS